MQIYGSFYGFEQRTNVNRHFKIYATDQGIFGAWIAPFDYEEMMARFGGHGIGDARGTGLQQVARDAEKWERHYDEIMPDTAALLAGNIMNFVFKPEETKVALTWKLNFMEKAATRFGAFDIMPTGGKKRRFYLIGRRTPDEVAAIIRKALPHATIEGGPLASDPFTALDRTSQNASNNAQPISSGPVYKKPNWLVIIPAYIAAILLSLAIAAQYHFWPPLVLCLIAPNLYKMFRCGGILVNFHSNTAEQLKRDRAAQDAQK